MIYGPKQKKSNNESTIRRFFASKMRGKPLLGAGTFIPAPTAFLGRKKYPAFSGHLSEPKLWQISDG